MGWMIGRPTAKKDLTAEKAAHLVLDGGWESFGIPAIVTSDRGNSLWGSGGAPCLPGSALGTP